MGDGVIKNGRIYFGAAPSVPFHEEAKKGLRKLASHLRRWDKAVGFDYRIGPETSSMVRCGKIKLHERFWRLQVCQILLVAKDAGGGRVHFRQVTLQAFDPLGRQTYVNKSSTPITQTAC